MNDAAGAPSSRAPHETFLYFNTPRIPPRQLRRIRGLENGPLGVQNGSWDLQIGAKMGPGRPKSGLGGSRDLQNWILDGLEGGLEGSGLAWTAILGVQGPVWTPSWGHLGAPGGVSGSILEGFGGPKRVQKSNFLDPKWKSAK